jgi:hypothetical protein
MLRVMDVARVIAGHARSGLRASRRASPAPGFRGVADMRPIFVVPVMGCAKLAACASTISATTFP